MSKQTDQNKKKAYWYDEFLAEVKSDPNFKKVTMALVEEIDKLIDRPTIEKTTKMKEKVDKTLIPEVYKEKLFRRINIYERRLNRGVPESFGPLLRRVREQKGYTLRDLAKRSGVTASYIQRIETGNKTAPTPGIINNLSRALDNYDLIAVSAGDTINNEKSPVNLSELIIGSTFKINDKDATAEEKIAIIDILEIATNKSFTEYPKAQENILDIVNKIVQLQNLIKEDNDTSE